MEGEVKGTVTSLASMFPVDEAQKAAKRVEEAIEGKKKELENLRHFISDNTNLINLVNKLPVDLHHDIMVPFGKAAFLPGRLIHTNEFMVLLGEGYYAERTSKQTMEILKRRGKGLSSQVESLKANMEDLKAEASFFDATALDAAEGLVEIREDYMQENSNEERSQSALANETVNVEDEEYARMMSKVDELEREEMAAEGYSESYKNKEISIAESDKGSDEEEQTSMAASDNGSDEEEQTSLANSEKRGIDDVESSEAEDESDNYAFTQAKGTHLQVSDQSHSQIKNHQKLTIAEDTSNEIPQDNCAGLTVQPLPKANRTKVPLAAKTLVTPKVKEKTEADSSYGNEAFGSLIKNPQNIQKNSNAQNMASSQTSSSGFDADKAFTGSIVEHTANLQITQQDKAAPPSELSNNQPSKPVSRFKMQRR